MEIVISRYLFNLRVVNKQVRADRDNEIYFVSVQRMRCSRKWFASDTYLVRSLKHFGKYAKKSKTVSCQNLTKTKKKYKCMGSNYESFNFQTNFHKNQPDIFYTLPW